jgi:hypothetical protein
MVDFLKFLSEANQTFIILLFGIVGLAYFIYFKPRMEEKDKLQDTVDERIQNIPNKEDILMMIENVVAKIEKPNLELFYHQIYELIKDSNEIFTARLDSITIEVAMKIKEIQATVESINSQIEGYIASEHAKNEIVAETITDLLNGINIMENLIEYLILEMANRELIDPIDTKKLDEIKVYFSTTRLNINSLLNSLSETNQTSQRKTKLNKVLGKTRLL